MDYRKEYEKRTGWTFDRIPTNDYRNYLETRLKDTEEKLERAVEWIKNAHKKDCYFMKPYTFKDNPKCDCKKNNFLKSLTPEPLPKEN